MTDPPGSDRIQQRIPTSSGSGNSGSSFEDVPLSRDEAIERDPTPDGEVSGPTQ